MLDRYFEMKKHWIGLLAAFVPIFAGAQVEKPISETPKPVSDYVRFLKAETADQSDVLQTAIVRFERKSDGKVVDLVAVVHIGDQRYYDQIDLVLKNYDAVLYELVGGEFSQRAVNPPAEEMGGVRGMQGIAKSLLGLEFQLDSVDYEAKNFIHADVLWDEFNQLMVAKNQSMATMFSRAMELASKGEIEGMPTSEKDSNAMLISLIGSLASGDSAALKRTIAPFLAEAETLITQLEGEDGTVLVSERNKVVMKKLKSEIGAKKSKLAIFYGAGHMPDLEDRLIADGFTKKNFSWATAWEIAHPKKGSGSASSQFFQNLLSEDTSMLDFLQSFGNALNEANQSQKPAPPAEAEAKEK